MHHTYMTTEAVTTTHVEVFRVFALIKLHAVKFRLQISNEELLITNLKPKFI